MLPIQASAIFLGIYVFFSFVILQFIWCFVIIYFAVHIRNMWLVESGYSIESST